MSGDLGDVRKVASFAFVSSELLHQPAATDEDRERWRLQREARKARRDELAQLLQALPPGIVRDIAQLHQRRHGEECDGCDFAGWEAESPGWPCRTARLIGHSLGWTDIQ